MDADSNIQFQLIQLQETLIGQTQKITAYYLK